MNKDVWKTKDNRTLLITDMQDDHIINAICYVRKQTRTSLNGLVGYMSEVNQFLVRSSLTSKGNALNEIISSQIRRSETIIEGLVKEANKRQLEIPQEPRW